MKYTIAIVGCGGVSPMHLDGCARHQDVVEVAAACDPDSARLAQAQRKYGITRGFSSVSEMITGAEWTAAIVCTPTSVRAPIVAELAAAGKHVLVEKPFSSSLDEGRRMVELAESAGVVLGVDQNFRYHFPFHIAKKQIAAGRLGRVTAIHHQHLCLRQDEGWRTLEKRHVLEIMGVHWLDGFRWILGSDASSVSARLRHSTAIECSGETDASVQIAYENGVIASYAESFSSHFQRAETLIVGDEATMQLSYDSAALYNRGEIKPAREWQNCYAGDGKPDSAFKCLELLLEAVRHGTEPQNSGRDNLKTLSSLEACYRSSEAGRTIELSGGLL